MSFRASFVALILASFNAFAAKLSFPNIVGLEPAKDALQKYLQTPDVKKEKNVFSDSPVIVFSGPRGLGKTSLVKSFADETSQNIYRARQGKAVLFAAAKKNGPMASPTRLALWHRQPASWTSLSHSHLTSSSSYPSSSRNSNGSLLERSTSPIIVPLRAACFPCRAVW